MVIHGDLAFQKEKTEKGTYYVDIEGQSTEIEMKWKVTMGERKTQFSTMFFCSQQSLLIVVAIYVDCGMFLTRFITYVCSLNIIKFFILFNSIK